MSTAGESDRTRPYDLAFTKVMEETAPDPFPDSSAHRVSEEGQTLISSVAQRKLEKAWDGVSQRLSDVESHFTSKQSELEKTIKPIPTLAKDIRHLKARELEHNRLNEKISQDLDTLRHDVTKLTQRIVNLEQLASEMRNESIQCSKDRTTLRDNHAKLEEDHLSAIDDGSQKLRDLDQEVKSLHKSIEKLQKRVNVVTQIFLTRIRVLNTRLCALNATAVVTTKNSLLEETLLHQLSLSLTSTLNRRSTFALIEPIIPLKEIRQINPYATHSTELRQKFICTPMASPTKNGPVVDFRKAFAPKRKTSSVVPAPSDPPAVASSQGEPPGEFDGQPEWHGISNKRLKTSHPHLNPQRWRLGPKRPKTVSGRGERMDDVFKRRQRIVDSALKIRQRVSHKRAVNVPAPNPTTTENLSPREQIAKEDIREDVTKTAKVTAGRRGFTEGHDGEEEVNGDRKPSEKVKEAFTNANARLAGLTTSALPGSDEDQINEARNSTSSIINADSESLPGEDSIPDVTREADHTRLHPHSVGHVDASDPDVSFEDDLDEYVKEVDELTPSPRHRPKEKAAVLRRSWSEVWKTGSQRNVEPVNSTNDALHSVSTRDSGGTQGSDSDITPTASAIIHHTGVGDASLVPTVPTSLDSFDHAPSVDNTTLPAQSESTSKEPQPGLLGKAKAYLAGLPVWPAGHPESQNFPPATGSAPALRLEPTELLELESAADLVIGLSFQLTEREHSPTLDGSSVYQSITSFATGHTFDIEEEIDVEKALLEALPSVTALSDTSSNRVQDALPFSGVIQQESSSVLQETEINTDTSAPSWGRMKDSVKSRRSSPVGVSEAFPNGLQDDLPFFEGNPQELSSVPRETSINNADASVPSRRKLKDSMKPRRSSPVGVSELVQADTIQEATNRVRPEGRPTEPTTGAKGPAQRVKTTQTIRRTRSGLIFGIEKPLPDEVAHESAKKVLQPTPSSRSLNQSSKLIGPSISQEKAKVVKTYGKRLLPAEPDPSSSKHSSILKKQVSIPYVAVPPMPQKYLSISTMAPAYMDDRQLDEVQSTEDFYNAEAGRGKSGKESIRLGDDVEFDERSDEDEINDEEVEQGYDTDRGSTDREPEDEVEEESSEEDVLNHGKERRPGTRSHMCSCPMIHQLGCHLNKNRSRKSHCRNLVNYARRDSDSDVSDYRIRHREPERVVLQRNVRTMVVALCKTGHDTYHLASQKQINVFNRTQAADHGPSVIGEPPKLALDLQSSSTSSSIWNKRVAYTFADHFIQQHSLSTKLGKVIRDMFLTYLKQFFREYHSVTIPPEDRDEAQAVIAKENTEMARLNRQRILCERRVEICHLFHERYPSSKSLETFSAVWQRAPKEACSDDEAVVTKEGKLYYRKLKPDWRSSEPEVELWFKTFDHLHMSTHFRRDGKRKRGRLPRHRVPPQKTGGSSLEKENYPKGLPLNFYDATWLDALDKHQRKVLRVQPPIDLTFDDDIQSLADKWSNKKGEIPLTIPLFPIFIWVFPAFSHHVATADEHPTSAAPPPSPPQSPSVPIPDDRLTVEELSNDWCMTVLKRIKHRLSERIVAQFADRPLFFKVDPTRDSRPLDGDALALDDESELNVPVLNHENWLNHHHELLSTLANKHVHNHRISSQISKITQKIEVEQRLLVRVKARAWKNQQRAAMNSSKVQLVDSRSYAIPRHTMLEPFDLLCYILVVALHLLSNVLYNACKFFIQGMKMAFALSNENSTFPNSPALSKSLEDDLPNTVEDMLDALGLKPAFKSFVCCPKCFCTYDTETSYPDICTNIDNPGEKACGRKLRVERANGKSAPSREYLAQEFTNWLARLYSRPEIEEHLDRAGESSGAKGVMRDIWDAPVMKNFKDRDGTHFFSHPGRLAFSLNMDGFNPFTNKQAGKKITTCGMYLVCLNLPPELRYRSENVFLVGLIPGPAEPSLHQIDHVVRHLVDCFVSLWEDGIYLTHTTKHPSGRTIRAVIIPLVCDLPAARQVAGLPGHNGMLFCSECLLPLTDIDNLNFEEWEHCTCARHCAAALQWKNAVSRDKRQELLRKNGARWSELLRLPYWDPTVYVAIDTMHCFFLGLFRRHVKDIWGMDVDMPDGEGRSFYVKKEPTEDEMKNAWKVLNSGRCLKNLHHHVLAGLCRDLGLRFAGNKDRLVSLLENYRSTSITYETDHEQSEPETLPRSQKPTKAANKSKKRAKATSVLGKETLAEIRKDMEQIQVPSWVLPGPSHPGEEKWGKLHADQWRSFCTIHLPITLVRLWGKDPAGSKRYKMLENFLHLVTAVKLGSLRTTSSQRAELYEYHMSCYLRSLLELYPGTKITPYQHMAMHIGQQLRRFGPTHAWRCYAFERFNHIFQVIQTNNIYGQMEKTMFMRFCMMQNLCNIVHRATLPPRLHAFIDHFNKTFGNKISGTLFSDQGYDVHEETKGKNSWVSNEVKELFVHRYLSWKTKFPVLPSHLAKTYRRLHYNGLTLATTDCSAKDSHIMARRRTEGLGWAACRIIEIFSLSSDADGIFIYAEEFKKAMGLEIRAPFTEFPIILGGLFSLQSPSCVILRLDEVLGQFCLAETDYGLDVFQAIPMEKD
ncbi:hypothetical protein NP233_g7126 [Leucocoprinus birnbaumii]|uniref:Uncharacterized protein n=1 Tax=Leucocoprinus birnbaumii TaxID=56174 RepID=A0AAD5YV15_9AGAR|nr:hypothetical protein NP233_g7126 [Leucocoprinus birnbaumii]